MSTRRALLRSLAPCALAGALPARAWVAAEGLHRRVIPASGETLPAIGLGSWITFDVQAPRDVARSAEVIDAFFARGGALIDSSPMYGSAQAVIGKALAGREAVLFSATKVWTAGRIGGIRQMEQALALWGLSRFDLLQVHNLLDLRTHLGWLREWRTEGRVRYLGATTSHGRRHAAMEELIRGGGLDFVQFTYNLADREAERRLLPLARDHGVAVIINRPFQGGRLFDRVRARSLPPWAASIDCANWAQLFLKFIVSHPAVTCAIPATSRVAHLDENMGALQGALPDEPLRREMAAWFDANLR